MSTMRCVKVVKFATNLTAAFITNCWLLMTMRYVCAAIGNRTPIRPPEISAAFPTEPVPAITISGQAKNVWIITAHRTVLIFGGPSTNDPTTSVERTRLEEGKQLLIRTAGEINDMLNPRYEEHIAKIAESMKNVESMYIIGKGLNYPMALEAAIKLQEVSYIHAEGFASGELKHGPIALISQGTPCLTIVAPKRWSGVSISFKSPMNMKSVPKVIAPSFTKKIPIPKITKRANESTLSICARRHFLLSMVCLC